MALWKWSREGGNGLGRLKVTGRAVPALWSCLLSIMIRPLPSPHFSLSRLQEKWDRHTDTHLLTRTSRRLSRVKIYFDAAKNQWQHKGSMSRDNVRKLFHGFVAPGRIQPGARPGWAVPTHHAPHSRALPRLRPLLLCTALHCTALILQTTALHITVLLLYTSPPQK
jgi:hypothetical protein